MSQAPHVIRGARGGLRLGQGALEDSLMVALHGLLLRLYMAQTSDNLRASSTASRARSRTSSRCARTRSATRRRTNGRFAEEIVPVEVKQGRKTAMVEKDDHLFPRPRSRKAGEAAAGVRPESFVTAGNASGIVDGAAARGGDDAAERAPAPGKKPLGFVRGYASVGVDPDDHGHRPGAGDPQGAASARASRVEDVDLFEINEAFAGQYLAVEKDARARPRARST